MMPCKSFFELYENLLPQIGSRFPSLCTKLGAWYDRYYVRQDTILREAQDAQNTVLTNENIFQFSVGIPHFNRGKEIHRPLKNILKHSAVAEIVIVDDGSSTEEFAALEASLSKLGNPNKIRLFRREENRRALETKRECVERATLPWVLILDSDNTLFCSYLNTLAELKNPDPEVIYAASWAFPAFSFHPLSGKTLDFEALCSLTISGVLRRIFIINDGNYLVNRDSYLKNINSIGRLSADYADVMLANYKCISEGMSLKILPGTAYYHRMHSASRWMQAPEKSRNRVMKIFSRLENNQRWDNEFLSELRRESSAILHK